MEVNRSVDVGQVALLSATEQVAYELRDREVSVMAKLVKEFFVLIRNRRVNIFVSCKFLLCTDSSHVLSFVVVNSRSAALIIQNIPPLIVECRSEDKK